MTLLKFRHYAFNEGRIGRSNGCDRRDNPYDDGIRYNAEAARQWAAGWDHEDRSIKIGGKTNGKA